MQKRGVINQHLLNHLSDPLVILWVNANENWGHLSIINGRKLKLLARCMTGIATPRRVIYLLNFEFLATGVLNPSVRVI